MGIRARFSFFFLLMSLLSLGGFATIIFYQFQHKLILNAEQTVTLHLEHEWRHFEFPKSSHGVPEPSSPHLKDIYQKFLKNGELFYDSFPKNFTNLLPSAGVSEGAVVIRLIKELEGDRFELLGYYDLTSTRSYLKTLRNLLIAGCLLASIFLFPLSFFFTKILLRPFTVLAHKTTELHVEQLSFRFPPPKHTDEYGILVRSFNDLLNRLEKSFLQLRYFAGNASHELRTPVAAIIGQAEMHLRTHKEAEETEGSVSRILKQAKRLSKIIDQLLFLSEVDRAELENRRSVVPVNERIQDAVEVLLPKFRPEGKTLSFSAGSDKVALKTNPELLLVAVSNLIENALKFSRKEVRVETELTEQNTFEIRVYDDGPGIPEENRQNVLTPFVKSRTVDGSKKNEGYGLGLSIAKACTEALNGKLSFGDSYLGGLKATLSLPATT